MDAKTALEMEGGAHMTTETGDVLADDSVSGTNKDAMRAEPSEEVGLGHVDGNNKSARLGSDGWAVYPSVLERYYETHILSNYQAVSVHSNGCGSPPTRCHVHTHAARGLALIGNIAAPRLCVLGVAPTHPMLQPPNRVIAVKYRDHDSKNLAELDVSGKKKRGAHWVQPRDLICTVSLSDGSEVTLYACIRGSVIEANLRLVEQPSLLGTPDGFVAVLMPKIAEKKSVADACLEFDTST